MEALFSRHAKYHNVRFMRHKRAWDDSRQNGMASQMMRHQFMLRVHARLADWTVIVWCHWLR